MSRMERLFQMRNKMTFTRFGFLLFFLASSHHGMPSPEATHDHGENATETTPDHASGAEGRVKIQDIEGFQHKLEKLIEKTYSTSQFFYCCDLMRLYVARFPASDKNDLYLSDLRNVKSTLLARGRDSLAKANSADQRLVQFSMRRVNSGRRGPSRNQALEDEALRLARGDETLANGYLGDYDVAVGKYLEAAVYLSAHCLIFPNSKDNSQILGNAAKSAEIAGLPLLEIEMRLRLLRRNAGQVAFSSAEILSEKARRQSRYFIAINVLDRFLKQDYSHPKAGPGFVLSGDIHELAGCYEAAAAKYNQALLWCGDMKRINYSENNDTNGFTLEIAAIQRRANLSIGYALLTEAKRRHLRESTAVFAGKLHDQAIAKFEKLVKSVKPGSRESLNFLLGLARARVESARYKQSHSSVLGHDEIQDAYARCIPVCESYLRVMDLGFTSDENAYPSVIRHDRHEVAFVLMEALFAIGKTELGEGMFFKYFISPTDRGNSKWRALAKTKIAVRLVSTGDYLMAYPLLSEVVQEAREAGLRDVGFAAALMQGICISKLNPTVNSRAVFGAFNIGEGPGTNQVSGAQLVRDAYLSALSILNDPSVKNSIDYPVEFRGLFQENIVEELVAEFRNELKYLETGWDPLDLSGRKALLVEALSNVNPEKSPFNPNSLLVTAFLKAQR
jgi:tetratricopeptide (TPR) repeat protein